MHEIVQLLMLVWRVMFSKKNIDFFPFSLQEQVLRMGNKSEELKEQLLTASQKCQEKEEEEEVSQKSLPCK